MSENPSKANCQEFQSQLPELLAAGADLDNHPHLKGCELCRDLVDDLHRIAESSGHGRFEADT